MYFFATVHSTMTIVFEIRTFNFHGGDPSLIEAFSNQNRVFRGFIAVAFVMSVLIADILFVSVFNVNCAPNDLLTRL